MPVKAKEPKLSSLERTMLLLIRASGLPEPVLQCRIYPSEPLPGRTKVMPFRFDFAWPDKLVALEVHGGTWRNGGHNRGKGFERDCRKLNLAAEQGWMVFQVTTDMVTEAGTLKMLQRALA